MLKFINSLLILAVLTFVLESCTPSANDSNGDANSQDSVSTSFDSAGAISVLSLPAPLQISNALNELSSKFKSELLGPYDPSKEAVFSNSHKAIVFGMLGVDMGYAMFNNEQQLAINYFSRISRMADELNIEGAFDKGMVESFRANINNNDSLIPLTLSGFNNAHNYLEENNRRSEGLLILAGCFIEGLHISIGHAKADRSKEILNVVGQQKLYLDNFIELFNDYNEKPEVKELVADFMDIKTIYDQIEIKYGEGDNSGARKISEIPISDELLNQLDIKIENLRKKMLS